MRLIYADSGLVSNTGHHASVCRAFLRETHARGIQTVLLAGTGIAPGLRAELAAFPLFRVSPYYFTTEDPLCGWFDGFLSGAQNTAEDYSRLSDTTADDILYVTACQPAHLAGLVSWLGKLAPERMPTVVVDLIYGAGMNPKPGTNNEVWESRDPREDARAVFYRHIGLRLNEMKLPRLRFITTHPAMPKVYSILLSREVVYTPAQPHAIPERLRRRAGTRPITVGIVGHQRPDKGYPFMPEVFAALLDGRADIRILVHNSGPSKYRLADTERALADLALRDPRLSLFHDALSPEQYEELLETIDLMLCPYDPKVYGASLSGVVMECLIRAIPLVVPDGSVNSDQFRIFGPSGTAFERFEAASITAAAQRALENYDAHAAAALTTAQQWARDNNPGKFLDAVLRLAAHAEESVKA